MGSKWEFDRDFLKKYIKMWDESIKTANLSDSEKALLKDEKSMFNRFLKGEYSISDGYIGRYKSIDNLRRYVLSKMKYEYEMLGPELIDYIQSLYSSDIFCSVGSPRPDVPIEIQEEYTLKTYEKNCKLFYKYAKQILSLKPTSMVQCTSYLEGSSWCFFSDLLDLPFLVIDPRETSNVLNHETQHGIDFLLKYQLVNNYYSELLPICFEILFDDLLFEKEGICDYDFRLEEMDSLLSDVCDYLNVMKKFAAMEFKVPLDKFKEIVTKDFSIDECVIVPVLNEIVVGDDFDFNFGYLVSYLKAIELRSELQKANSDCLSLISPYVRNYDFEFNPDYNNFKTYESFVSEACQKQLTMKRKTKLN